MKIIFKPIQEETIEFVERKGIGHPDTLADSLAERLSVNYSKYTKKKFGVILHHNFDKLGILGGSSYVAFNNGYLINPIRILINGRASTKFGNVNIPVRKLLIKWSRGFFKERFPIINIEKDLEFFYNLSNQSGPGKTEETCPEEATRKYWFEPRGLHDIQEITRLVSNDTSLGIGYFPYTRLETLVLRIEGILNSKGFNEKNPWIGSDIKIMGFRNNDDFHITLCIPQIANHVKSLREYKRNLKLARNEILKIAESLQIPKLEINVNTRDNFNTLELYLTAIGSSIESGDEGLVGRGNRINGLISPFKPMSMEGACGKNPVYHIGKVYYVAAMEISKKIYSKFGAANEVYLASQSGRDLTDPWKTIIVIDGNNKVTDIKLLKKFVKDQLKKIPKLTTGLVEGKYQLY